MRKLAAGVGALLVAVAVLGGPLSGTAEATLIVSVLPEFNGPSHVVGDPYPLPPITVGTFVYSIPAGETIISATIESTFGNSIAANTAGVDYFVDTVQVAQCVPYATCWAGAGPFPWSFTFAATDRPLLADGIAKFTAVQTNEFVIRTGPSTLTIETAPVPEPASMVLLGTGLAGLRLLKRRRQR